MEDDLPRLVQRAVAGDRTAQGDLARRMYPRLVALCQSRVGQRADAEETAQETLLRALRSLDQLESPRNWNGWVRGIAEHVCLDWHRQRRRSRGFSREANHPQDDPGLMASIREEQEQLRQLIVELPADLREVLYLHYYDGMTYDEMASWLGVARATVNERLSKARTHLRYRLIPQGRDAT